MSSSYLIRELLENDYIQYYRLIREFRETTFTEYEFKEFIEKLPSNIKIYVLVYDNTIIATITIIYEPKLIFNKCIFAHIEDVCVLESYRKGGWGSKILQYAIEEAKKKKCYKVTLVCNEKVSYFYLKNNFEKRGIQCSMLL